LAYRYPFFAVPFHNPINGLTHLKGNQMPTLADILLTESRAQAISTECGKMIDNHVDSIKGLRGMGIRTAFSMLKAGRPEGNSGPMNRLLPDFVTALEPYYQTFLTGGGGDFGAFLTARGPEVNKALIGAIDSRVGRSTNPTLKSMYPKFRDSIESEMSGVTPKIAAIIAKHIA
jgi:hypothetical protein